METFTPGEAARAFADARRWEGSLVQRTEGITWMIWGLVTAGIAPTLNLLVLLSLPQWLAVLGWTPWVAAGSLATFALWRSAALARREPIETPTPLGLVLRAAVIVGMLLFLHFVVRPQTMAAPIAVIGVAWMAMGAFGRRLSTMGRRVSLVGGALVFAAGAGMGLLATPMEATMALAPLVLGGVPVALGLWQTLRG